MNKSRVLKTPLLENPSEVTVLHCSVNYFSPLVFHTCRGMSAQARQAAAEPGHDWYLWLFRFVPSPEGVAAQWASSSSAVSHVCCCNSSLLIALAHLECWEGRRIGGLIVCVWVWKSRCKSMFLHASQPTCTHTHSSCRWPNRHTLTALLISPLKSSSVMRRRCRWRRGGWLNNNY